MQEINEIENEYQLILHKKNNIKSLTHTTVNLIFCCHLVLPCKLNAIIAWRKREGWNK